MVSPDSLGTACPLSGRNSTYRPVQISDTSSCQDLLTRIAKHSHHTSTCVHGWRGRSRRHLHAIPFDPEGGKSMAGWAARRNVARGRMSRAEAGWLICIVFVVCAIGFYGYKYWNVLPPTAIIGKAWVIDGDTDVILGTHIRLEGIDAPETDQTCMDAKEKPWPCGPSNRDKRCARPDDQDSLPRRPPRASPLCDLIHICFPGNDIQSINLP
jgi:hypothetical protein